jgi:AcrR family transcriptional regulator
MPKITEIQREARRRQILNAALACFSENGFHQTGLADIQRRSGLSHGALYLYFRSKDEIIAALAVDRHREEAALNTAALEAESPVAVLKALIARYALSLADPEGEARRRVGVNGWAEALRNETVRASVLEGIKEPIAFIASVIERGQAARLVAGHIDAQSAARALVALFQGFVLQSVWGEPLDVAGCLAVAERMIEGLLAPAEAES